MAHVYRLKIDYPPGSQEPGWEPAGWIPRLGQEPETGATVELPFRWPSERRFLSFAGARARVRELEGYGAAVTLERSLPVEWPA